MAWSLLLTLDPVGAATGEPKCSGPVSESPLTSFMPRRPSELSFQTHAFFIATGSSDSGGSTTSSTLDESYVYPNPVRPSFNMNIDKIKISGITDDINIKITDISGNLVAEANSNVNNRYNGFNLEIDGGVAYWNGKNLANNSVSSGVYIVMLSDLESYETKILKIMIIR